jgi:DNA-binding transcriptional regulator GbsR (MarR family)
MDATRRATWEMIEAGGRTAQSFGLNRLLGQAYVLLYLSPEPRSLDEVASDLGVSKASVSIACRQLDSWGALKRVWKKGDRRDYYEVETDLGRFLNNGVLASLTKKLDSAKLQIERSMEMLDGRDGDTEFLRRRLREAEGYRNKVARLINNPLIRKLF